MVIYDRSNTLYNEVEILVTLESYNKKANTILFDFIDNKHYLKFLDLINDNLSFDIKGASMLYITNFSDKKIFKDGVYYNINKQTISEIRDRIILEEDSAVIRYKIDLGKREIKSLLSTTKISTEYISGIIDAEKSSNVEFDNLLLDNQVFKSIRLIIRNVGQGSWNEFFIDNSPKIIFDIGTTYLAKRKTVQELIATRNKDYQLSKPIIILSHWDVDHYHLLLEAEDETIKSIACFIYRSKIPNKKSRDLIKRFSDLNPDALCPIPEEVSIPPKKSSDKLEMYKKLMSHFNIYNGSKNQSRNKGGILLTFNTNKLSVVCSADFHYSQINEFVLPNLNFKHDNYLIVPHHGGNAGKLIYEIKEARFKDAIISVGKNSYGHPFESTKEGLRLLKFNPIDFRLKDSGEQYELDLIY